MLDNIEPFNDIFYQSCFFNSFFPIVHHFNMSIIPFMSNYVNVYRFDSDKSTLNLEYIEENTFEEVMKRSKLRCYSKRISTDIINDIIESLSRYRPVILQVDCFYEKIREDAYLKMHLPHTLLIYGYDKGQEIFNIIEHKRYEDVSYEKMKISFNDIVNSYNGYLSLLNNGNDYPSFNAYFTDGCINDKKIGFNQEENFYDFIENMYHNREAHIRSLGALREYKETFSRNVNYRNDFIEKSESAINSFNDIINAKRADRYLLSNILNDKAGVEFN